MTKSEYLDMYDFIGAAQEVHRTIGRGLEEAVYQEALGIELGLRQSDYEEQHRINLWYKGVKMNKYYIADYYYKGIMVEIKSVAHLLPEHRAQLFNYMRLCRVNKGLLINFGESSLRAERFVYSLENDDFILLTKINYKNYITDKEISE